MGESIDTSKSNESYWKVSKAEEGTAVRFILKRLLPSAWKTYSRKYYPNLFGFKKITYEDILKRFKKSNVTIDTNWYGHRISYEVDLTEYAPIDQKIKKRGIYFEIYKNTNNNGNLMVQMGFLEGHGEDNEMWDLSNELRENREYDVKDPNKTISRVEELEALQHIKNVIIPIAVNKWNSAGRQYEKVTKEEVLSNLKKVSHNRPNPLLSNWDLICYQSELPNSSMYTKEIQLKNDPNQLKIKFWFHITKEGLVSSSTLKVSCSNSMAQPRFIYVVSQEPIKENIEITEKYDSRHVITRSEEAQAVHLILRYFIPADVREYNRECRFQERPEDQITEDEIKNNLTKVTAYNYLKEYLLRISEKINLVYRITKKGHHTEGGSFIDGDLLIGRIGHNISNESVWQYFSVETFDSQKHRFKPNKNIFENKENEIDRVISKIEEQQGIDIINRYLIPFQVERHNLREKLYNHGKNFITLEDVNRLVKIENLLGRKEYVAKHPDPNKHAEFHFVLSKVKTEDDDKYDVIPIIPTHLRIGMYDGWAFFDPGIRWFTIDDPMLKHLKSEIELECKKQTGKLVSQLKENSEEKEQKLKLSKVEESEAVNYYKKIILPKDVMNFNNYLRQVDQYKLKNYTNVREVTLEEVLVNFKKVEKRKSFDVEFTIYESKVYKLNNDPSESAWLRFRLTISKEYDSNVDKKDAEVIIRHWFTFNPLEHKVRLSENKEESIKITKLEEAESLNYISRVLVPAVVDDWNKRYISTAQAADVNIVRAGITKFNRHFYSYPPEEDTILYKAPSPNRSSPFLFQIKKQNGIIHVGYNHAFLSGMKCFRLDESNG